MENVTYRGAAQSNNLLQKQWTLFLSIHNMNANAIDRHDLLTSVLLKKSDFVIVSENIGLYVLKPNNDKKWDSAMDTY